MPLERKLLSKRHLRRKQAAALSQIDFLAKHNIEKNVDVHCEQDNSKCTLSIEAQACTATNLNCNMQHTPLVLPVEQEPASASDHEVSSGEIYSDVQTNVDNLENWVMPDYPLAQPFYIDSFLNSEWDLFSSNNEKTHIDDSDQSTDDNNEQVRFEKQFQEDLRKLACDCNITHTALDRILTLIRPRYPFLPKNAKSLLKTNREIKVSDFKNGQMCYTAIEEGLKGKLRSGLINSAKYTNTVIIDIYIDGLPLYKSSSVNLWPILCRSQSLKDSSPFMVAVFCGKGKPESLDSYLLEFIKEMNLLLQNGIKHNNRTLRIEIGCFLCDAPARAMLKMIKGHTSTFGCEKCCIAAVSLQRKLHYPVDQTYHRKRCDDDYLTEDPDTAHIKGISPLLRLLVGLVTQFPLDPMHLIYLGVLKRLLINYWIEGPRLCKLSKKMLKIISRNLDEVKRWKATEFRFFLVYLGPIILRDVLDPTRYKHFLLLHTAVYILSNETLISRYLEVARLAIEKFVRLSAKMYGPQFVVYNVHSILHLCDDVERYGKLQDFSCFPFENYLGTMKRKVRAKKLPLQQVVKRMSELAVVRKKKDLQSRAEAEIPKGIRPKTESAFQCETLTTTRFKLSIQDPDNVVSLNGKIYVIKSIICIDGVYKCVGISFRYLRNLYRKPIESSKLGIYFAKSYAEATTFLVDVISFKCLRFPVKDGFGVFPILHQKE